MRVSILVLLLILSMGSLGAEDWNQFRGPNGSGVAKTTGLPIQFDRQNNLVWKRSLPSGHSSPVLTEDRLFLTGFEATKLLTLCLDRQTGKILWRREAPRDRVEPCQKINTPASSTPVTDGKNVFVFFGDFGLIAYGSQGEELWRLPLGPFNNANGHGSLPILVNSDIVLICDQDTGSYLLAVDKHSGKVRWKTERPEFTRGYATPALFKPRTGPRELIVPGSFQLVAYSIDDGKRLWWVHGMSFQLKSVPVIGESVIYVNSWETSADRQQPEQVPSFEDVLASQDTNKDGKISLGEAPDRAAAGWQSDDLDKDGTMDARDWNFLRARRSAQNNLVAVKHGGQGDLTATNVAWRYRKSLPNAASPLLYEGILYLVRDGGIVTTLNPLSGQVFKQARLPGAAEQYWASPVAADGKVYIVSGQGKVSVLRANKEWMVLSLNDLNEECFATPALAAGRIYVRTRNTLYCFGKSPRAVSTDAQ